MKKMSDLMKLSVILPVYNEKPEYIERAVLSLNNQSFKQIEIIVVNDGSRKTETIDFLSQLSQNNLVVVHKKNGGLGSARNYGIQVATGDVLGFLDADDWIENDFYEKLMTTLVNEKADMACGVLIRKEKQYDNFPNYTAKTVEEKLKYINNGSVCSKIFKKELFKDVFFPTEKIYYEDNPVLLKLLMKSKKVSFNNQAKYQYFLNEESITRDKLKEEKRINDSCLILSQIKKIASKYDEKTDKLIMDTFGKILFRKNTYTDNEEYRVEMNKIFDKTQIKLFCKRKKSFLKKLYSFFSFH